MHDNSRSVWVRRQTMTLVSAVLSASLLASASGSPPEAQQRDTQRKQPGPAETFESVSADVTVSQGLVSQAGTQVGAPVPPARYRWQRRKNGRHWKTTMTMMSSVRPALRLLSGATKEIAPAIVRIEDDGDGTAPRFYDDRGREVQPPRAADVARSHKVLAGESLALPAVTNQPPGTQSRSIDEGWIRSLGVMRSEAKTRRDEVLRKFGPALGKLRGMERFLMAVEDGSVEVLIDPDTNVIREWNLVKKGELEARGSSVYDARVRRHARAAQVKGGAPVAERRRQPDVDRGRPRKCPVRIEVTCAATCHSTHDVSPCVRDLHGHRGRPGATGRVSPRRSFRT